MESVVMLQRLQPFYNGRKILVTGHTGFKGTWLTALLFRLGAKVKGYALPPEDSKAFHDLFESQKLCESVLADIRDRERLTKEIVSFQPDYIFHLAAQPLVLRSYKWPADTFETNVIGTANLLEAIRDMENRCSVVVVTTDKVYDNKEQHILYNEEDRLGGHDPYSASKACTEIVVSSFRDSFFNSSKFDVHQKAIASARAGNVIGGGDWSENRIIPDAARALLNNKNIEVRNPGSVRPWQHVLEPLCGYLLLGAALNSQPASFSKAYNFGPLPEDHLTVKELVEQAILTWGSGKMETVVSDKKPHEAGLLMLDIQKAITELEWHPRLSATDAIRWAIEWYKQNPARQANFTFEQIDNYLQR